MRAVVYANYGPPHVLRLRDVAKPVPADSEVLVKIHAAAVNAADLDLLRGTFMIRPSGLLKPRYPILGSDIAGTVEEVGPKVTEFRPGDEVFGDLTEYGFGAFAEYVCVPEKAVAFKPVSLTHEEAAAVPSAGGVALLNLRAKHEIQPGQSVLINGAGGGMGTFAIQIAKSSGAEVTGVDTGAKREVMLSTGADHVIDFTQEDVTRSGRRYDLILDVSAHRSIFHYRRILNPQGVYVLVGGSAMPMLQTVFLGPLVSRFGNGSMGIVMAYPNKDTLTSMTKLIEDGKVKPVIDRRYPLSEVADALRYLESGHACGKVVISLGNRHVADR